MTRKPLRRFALVGLALLATGSPAFAQEPGAADLVGRVEAIEAGLVELEAAAAEGDTPAVGRIATRLYLDRFEAIEVRYGPGAIPAAPALGERVATAERTFHALMGASAVEATGLIERLRGELRAIRRAAPAVETAVGRIEVEDEVATESRPAASEISPGSARTEEFAALLRQLDAARAAYREGDPETALAAVERAYLDGFEPLEPRLPASSVRRAERIVHLRLRPSIAAGASPSEVDRAFAELDAQLLELDASLSADRSFWVGAASSFAIIVREGLEAVLLIGAILAYLGRATRERRHVRQVWVGAAIGVGASFATWGLASTMVPVGGAGRELVEGITALLAVAVLIYVSHWLFQKTYIHGWKVYLQEKVGDAVTTGSALAMAGLAFAVVYREGFETVLFYQALLIDSGAGSVLAGFLPGVVLIVALGWGIIRLGLRLPLKRVFGVTNAILLYLAFVFLGKGIYALQEAGLFSPHPVAGAPDHGALRQILGFYPIAETILAQAAFVAALAVTWFLYRRRGRRAEAVAESQAETGPAKREAAARSAPGSSGGDEPSRAAVS